MIDTIWQLKAKCGYISNIYADTAQSRSIGWYILDIMSALNSLGLILAMTIIGLAGIALAANASLLLFRSASATTDMMTETVGGGQEPSNTASTTSAINNNNSNAVLGSLFLTGEDTLTSFNRINESYTELSSGGNRTITPPDATTTATIYATETGNLTFNLKLNGISIVEGKAF